MSTNPLVTVGVLSYNSAKTIIETLDSIVSQTYYNIELIVSDDCSLDNTVEIVNQWLSIHQNRFVKTKFLTVEENTGIAPNANRVVRNANGVFIKCIAADDILMPDCIEANLFYIGDYDMLVSDVERFNGDTVIEYKNPVDFNRIFSMSPSNRAHYYSRTLFFCNVPTLFVRMSLYNRVGLYDESQPLLEDVPFLLKVFASEAKVLYFPQKTVRYRINGISNSGKISFEHVLLQSFFKSRICYLKKTNILDRLLIYERKFYRFILGNREKSTFLIRAYRSRFNIFNRLLTKVLWRL